MSADVSFVPVISLFVGCSPRWIADNCRAGRIPGAIRIGKAWLIRPVDVDRLVAGASRNVPSVSVDDALADLRARGVCP